MAMSAIAEKIYDDIAVKRLAEIESQLGDVDGGLRIFAIDMEDRHLKHFGDVGAVSCRAGVARPGREANLIVNDNVHRTAGCIAGQLGQVQRLGNPSLPRESGIAM